MSDFNDAFIAEWTKNNEQYPKKDPFPQYVLDYADKIKYFMHPENRRYQGALGNANGMLDATKDYARQTTVEDPKQFFSNVKLIIEYVLKVRSTSQVPLNTAFFILQKIKKLNLKEVSIEELKNNLIAECDFHEQNYKKARDRIADVMAARIIDRCTEYDKTQIIIGTHCHSGAVIKTLIKSKDYISQVIVSKTEPEQQGVLTAHDLCEKGVPVKFINMEQYGTEFRKASMFLFGVDAVSAEGTVLNKAGTRMIATLARTKELPVYFLGETYKYARNTIYGGLVRVERRDVKENLLFNHLKIDLEKYANAGLLETSFQAFDTTKHELYDSIVSEQGFLPMREAFEREWAAYL